MGKLNPTLSLLNVLKIVKCLDKWTYLTYIDFSKLFNLTTDASNISIAGILYQGSVGSNRTIVAYIFQTLNHSEKSYSIEFMNINYKLNGYSIIEEDLLAILWATT